MIYPVKQRCPSCREEFMGSDSIGGLCPLCEKMGMGSDPYDPVIISAAVLGLKGISETDMQEAQRAGEFFEYASKYGLAVEALAAFIAGIRAGETVDEAIFRAQCEWDI